MHLHSHARVSCPIHRALAITRIRGSRRARQDDGPVEALTRSVAVQRPGNGVFDVLVADDLPQSASHPEIAVQCLELPAQAGKQCRARSCAARLAGDAGLNYGTLPAGVDVEAIIERHTPATG